MKLFYSYNQSLKICTRVEIDVFPRLMLLFYYLDSDLGRIKAVPVSYHSTNNDNQYQILYILF